LNQGDKLTPGALVMGSDVQVPLASNVLRRQEWLKAPPPSPTQFDPGSMSFFPGFTLTSLQLLPVKLVYGCSSL